MNRIFLALMVVFALTIAARPPRTTKLPGSPWTSVPLRKAPQNLAAFYGLGQMYMKLA
jgi:hypothetical protein